MVPPKARFVASYRVSTAKQGRSGLGLDAQQQTVREYLGRIGGIALASFMEIESGKLDERPQLDAALLRCQQSNATLLIAKLDRLSRNIAFLFRLREQGVKFQALDIPEANTMTLGVFAAMAQHERELISTRTKAALAARRARGLPLGTPRDLSRHQPRAAALGGAVNRQAAKARAQVIAPAIEAARADGHTSLRQIAEYLNEQAIPTPRGKAWTATAVANALRLID